MSSSGKSRFRPKRSRFQGERKIILRMKQILRQPSSVPAPDVSAVQVLFFIFLPFYWKKSCQLTVFISCIIVDFSKVVCRFLNFFCIKYWLVAMICRHKPTFLSSFLSSLDSNKIQAILSWSIQERLDLAVLRKWLKIYE
jgi:hypothetical protein